MWLGEKIECLLVAVSECVRFARAAAGVSSIQCRARGACRGEHQRDRGKETIRGRIRERESE